MEMRMTVLLGAGGEQALNGHVKTKNYWKGFKLYKTQTEFRTFLPVGGGRLPTLPAPAGQLERGKVQEMILWSDSYPAVLPL